MASSGTGSRKAALEARSRRGAQLQDLRRRGVRGGVISPHRAMVGIPWTGARLLTSVVLGLGGLALVLGGLRPVTALWCRLFAWIHPRLGLPGAIELRRVDLFGLLDFSLPTLGVEGTVPDAPALWFAAGIAAAVLALTFALRERFTPLAYFLRALVLIQASAILFFAIPGTQFPYRLPEYLVALLTGGLFITGLVPLVLAFTFHMFDVSLVRKVFLTLAIPAHLAVFIPLQALVHVWLVTRLTLLVQPVLFLVFGLLVDVLVFVAFYGWAMSWPRAGGAETAPAPGGGALP